MPGSTNSANSRSSKKARRQKPVKASPRSLSGLALLFIAATLTLIAATSASFFHSRGDTLAYGDAEAHLNIARKLWDNREPAYREIGTVWLPLPHLLMLPFTFSDSLYRSGLAGAIPSSLCWILAGTLLFAAIRKLAGGAWEPAACGLAIFVLNPNLLYLAATPMTEPVFYMTLAGLLHALAVYRDSSSRWALAGAVFWSWCAVLTRYEGWLLLPVTAVFLLTRNLRHAILYCAFVSLAPLWWLGHNWWIYGDALEFYRGEYSAKAIYARGHLNGVAPFPGEGHIGVAWLYYSTAAQTALDSPTCWIAAAGAIAAILKRWYWFALLLIMAPIVTIWGIYSGGGVEIFIPTLWPHSYYNTRYALALLPLAALGAAALVSLTPRLKGTAAIALAALAASYWIAFPRLDNFAVWKESQVNSVERRAWTHQLAATLSREYRPGDRVLYAFGDLTAVLREARVPLRAGLQNGNELEFLRTLARPDLFLDQEWVLDFTDGKAAQAALKRKDYAVLETIHREHGAASIVLLHRTGSRRISN